MEEGIETAACDRGRGRSRSLEGGVREGTSGDRINDGGKHQEIRWRGGEAAAKLT